MIRRKAQWARDETGQIVIMTALLLTVLLFAVGIAFDLGTLFVAKRTLQEAVDAASFAGAVAIYNGNAAGAVQAAKDDFALNGYSVTDPNIDSTASKTWWEASPSLTHVACPNSGQCMDIQITYNVKVPLLPAEGGYFAVVVRSTATSARQPSNYALMALNASSVDSLLVTSGGSVTVTGNVQVNSNHSTSAARGGGAGTFTVTATTPPFVAKAVGGVTTLPGVTPNTPPAIPDPFSGYLRPTTPSGAPKPMLNINNNATVTPDIYTGINLSGAPGGGATVTFNTGTYILAGGGFSATGNFGIASQLPASTNGVMFFNTHSNYPNSPVGTCSPINITVDSGITLSGVPSGYYAGMLFFQDPVCTNAMTINANSGIQTGNGSIYAPKAAVTIGGGGNMTLNGQIIADKITISELSVTIVYNSGTSASPSVPAIVY